MVNMGCWVWRQEGVGVGLRGGRLLGGIHITYPANLHQLSDHDDAETIFLPHHPPKIIKRLLLGS